MKKILLTLIKVYQNYISRIFGKKCRFYPTCSEYTYNAIDKYGVIKGCFLGIKRILKCHPFHSGGIDYLP